MLKDPFLLSIFDRISEPSLILSLNKGLVKIEALNGAFGMLMGIETDTFLDRDFFSLIDSGPDAEEVRIKLQGSFSLVATENLEDRFSLPFYSSMTGTTQSGIWEIQNVPLPTAQDKVSRILHTVKYISSVFGEKQFPVHNNSSPLHEKYSRGIMSTIDQYSDEPFILLDRSLMINYVNQSFRDLYSRYFGKEIIAGNNILNYAQPDRRETVKEIYLQVLSGMTKYSEILVPDLNGERRKLSLTYKPVMDKEGVVSGIFVSGSDVTLQRHTEQKLADNERELELIYDNLTESLFVISVEQGNRFKFNSINRSFLKTTGLSEDSVIGAYIDKVIPENHLAGAVSHYNEVIEKKSSVIREEKLQYPSGERTVIITITPVLDAKGTCFKLIGSIHDISERKKAEKENETITRTLSKILESSPDVICTLTEQGRFINVSAASNRMWGYSPYQLEGMFLGDLLHNEDRKLTKKALETIMNGQGITNFENRFKRKDGRYIFLVWSARWDSEEKIIYCVAKDATEKKKIQERVKASEQYFKALVQDGSDLIGILDSAGNYLYVSPTSLAVLGTAPEEYLGKNAFDLIHPDDRALTFEGFKRLAKEHKVALSPFRFLHRDGSWRWVETIITDLLNDPAVRGIVANSRDITERINDQKAVLVSNERYRLVSKATSDAVWDHDLETNTIYWGKGFQRLFGYRPGQLTSNVGLWEDSIHPDDVDRVKKKLYSFLMTSKTQWRDEYRFARADGSYASVTDKGLVVRDSEGKAIRIVGAMQDVTRQKREEQQLKLLESVVTGTNDLIMLTEPESIEGDGPKIIYVNPAFSRVTGYLPEEVIGKTPKLLQGAKSDKKELERLKKCMNTLDSCEISVINYKKNGEEFWNSFSISPVVNKKGKYTHWISIGRDVTDIRNRGIQEKLLSKISQVFNRPGGLGEIIGSTLKLLTQSGKFCYAEIWLLDHNNKQLNLAGMHASDARTKQFSRETRNITNLKKSEGIAGAVWEIEKGMLWDTSENRANMIRGKEAKKAGISAIFGLPLFYKDKFSGVLVLCSKEKESPVEKGVFSENFSRQLGAEIGRKQLEQELEQIFNYAPDIIAISDFWGYFKKLNPAASDILGYTETELMSRPFVDFLHPEDRSNTMDRISAPRSNATYYIEERYLTKSGKIKWLAWTSHSIEDQGQVFSVAKDITEKKNLKDLLAKSNSLSRIGSWEIDVIAGTVYWSDVTKEIREVNADFSPDLDTGIEYFKEDIDRITIRRKVDECIEYGLPWDEELEILTFKGNPKWIRTIGQAEMIDGRCVRIYGSFQDIDVRKRAEVEARRAVKDLEESEKRYSDLFQLSPLPMWVYDFETLKFLDVNRTATKHYGYTFKEFMGMTIRQIRPEDEVSALEDAIKLTTSKKLNIFQGVFSHKKNNGEVISVEVKSNIINFKGRKAKVVVVNDITERLRHFDAVEKQNIILREISWIQSHVVRAPLAKLMGFVPLLENRSMQNKEKQRYLLQCIKICAEELDGVIREITKKSDSHEKLTQLK